MTAPDPRLDEIQASTGRLLSTLAWAETPEERDEAENELTADVRYLLAELRKAHEALERVEAACDRIINNEDGHKPPGPPHPSQQQATAVRIRAAVAAAKGDPE